MVIAITSTVAAVIATNPLAIHWTALSASVVRDVSVAWSWISPAAAADST
jgi:hypothetical protein